MRTKSVSIFFWIIFIFLTAGAVFAENMDLSSRPIAPDARRHFETDLLTGSALFNMPIVVPEGRKGIQPNISLMYSSANSNGWCGMGWDLNLGFIQRGTKKGVPEYDGSDTFISSFNGLNSELANIGGLEYRAKIESQFLRFYYNNSKDFWEVTDKNGTKYFFGLDRSSRISGPDDKGVFKWCLDKVIDVYGNYMKISYIEDKGQVYPKQIVYTGNEFTGDVPKYCIEFVLEDRQDAPPSYISGRSVRAAKRLYQIDVKVNSARARKYILNYIYSSNTSRSLLSSIAQYGADGACALPPITFDYQSGKPKPIMPKNIPELGKGNNTWKVRLSIGNKNFPEGDLVLHPSDEIFPMSGSYPAFSDDTGIEEWSRGDISSSGSKDGVSWSSDASNGNFQCKVSEGTAFYASTYIYVEKVIPLTMSLSEETAPACFLNGELVEPRYNPELELKPGFNFIEITGYHQKAGEAEQTFTLGGAPANIAKIMSSKKTFLSSPVGDFNGDAKSDLGCYDSERGSWDVALSQGETFSASQEWWKGDTTCRTFRIPVAGDFNGDGLTDAGTHIYDGPTGISFSDSSKFSLAFVHPDSVVDPYSVPFTGDFNGDGLTDIGYIMPCTFAWGIFLSDGTGFELYYKTGPEGISGSPIIGDFNGDGLADLGGYSYGSWSVALSKGKGFEDSCLWLSGFGSEETPLAADFNNDGLTDIGYFESDTGRWKVAFSDGTKFIPAGTWLDNFGRGVVWSPQCGDFNGDGLLDAGIFNTASAQGEKRAMAYTDGVMPDLLSGISNGLGGFLTITYKPSTEFKNAFLPFVVQAVDKVVKNDGLGGVYTTDYSYADGLYVAKDREFRGFGYVKAKDTEGDITETWFCRQGIDASVYRGKIERQKISNVQNVPLQEAVNTWENIQPYADNLGVKFPYLKSETRYLYKPDGASKQTKTDYEYDKYGNVTVVVDYGEVEEGKDVSNNKRFTYNEYAYNKDKWMLNKLARVCTQNYRGDRISEKWFYYDNHAKYTDKPDRGSLTKEESWYYNPFTDSSSVPAAHYSYDEYGNCTLVIDTKGSKTTTFYDKFYHTYPESITNALGHTKKFTYDPVTGQVLTSTDANNNITRNEYDKFGRLVKVFGPGDNSDKPRSRYEYDLESFPTKVTTYTREEKNTDKILTSVTFYDGLSRVIQTKSESEKPAQYIAKETVVYDSKARIKKKYLPFFSDSLSEYSPPGSSTPSSSFTYDCLGRNILSINPDNTFASTVYSGWVSEAIDENGQRKRFTKDSRGNLIRTEEFNAGEIYTTTYVYDALDNLIYITDAIGNTTHMIYDSFSQKAYMKDPDMGEWSYEYDLNGNLTKQTDAKGQVIEFEYDALNRLTRKSAGDVKYYYDNRAKKNCLGRLSEVIYPGGRTEYFYDEEGREVKTVKTIGSAVFTTQRSYDLLGRVTSIIYPDGEEVIYTYNKQGKTEKIQGNDVYVANINYTVTDQIDKIEYGNGVATSYKYNPQNLLLTNLSTVNFQNKKLQELSYGFDFVGNITAINDSVNTATQSFRYDSLNRLTYAKGGYGEKNYQYDSIGNMFQKGDTAFTYGENGAGPHALTSVKKNNTTQTLIYDVNGNMTAKGDTEYRYNAQNQLIEVSGSLTSDIIDSEISLNPQWNFISLPVMPDNLNLDTILSRLSKADYDQVSRYNPDKEDFEHYCGNPKFNQFEAMEYGRGYQLYVTNPSGAKLTVSGRVPAGEGIALSRGWNLIGAPTTSQISVKEALSNLAKGADYDRILAYNPNSKTFSELSETDNLEAGKSYFINALRAVIWNLPSQYSSITFAYDYEGNRIRKVSQEGATIYVDDTYELENNKVTKHIFAGSIRICSITKEEGKEKQTRYFHQDHIGSSNVITDQTGAQIQLIEYAPFGEISLLSGTDLTNYKYTGKELDSSTGLYYYGARYYDAVLSHFISPDPIIQDTSDPQTLNHYAYCRNNPLIYTDPTGLAWGDSSFGMGYNSYNSWGSSWGNTWNSLTSSISSTWNNAVTGLRDYTSSMYNTINSWTTSAMNNISTFGQGVWQGTTSAIGTGFNAIGSGLNAIGSGIGSAFEYGINSINKGLSGLTSGDLGRIGAIGKISSYIIAADTVILKAQYMTKSLAKFQMAGAFLSALSYAKPYSLATRGVISVSDAQAMIWVRTAGNLARMGVGTLGALGGAALGEFINPIGGAIPGGIAGAIGASAVFESRIVRAENYFLKQLGVGYGY